MLLSGYNLVTLIPCRSLCIFTRCPWRVLFSKYGKTPEISLKTRKARLLERIVHDNILTGPETEVVPSSARKWEKWHLYRHEDRYTTASRTG